MGDFGKKTAKCPACGMTWHVDTKHMESRVLICPQCKRVDFVEYLVDKPIDEKKGYTSSHPVLGKSPSKSREEPESPETIFHPTHSSKSKHPGKQEDSWSLTSDCFIVTATYGTSSYEKIAVFYRFRDDLLIKNFFGRVFTRVYYKTSPFLAYFIRKSKALRGLSVFFLDHIAGILQKRL